MADRGEVAVSILWQSELVKGQKRGRRRRAGSEYYENKYIKFASVYKLTPTLIFSLFGLYF